MARDVRHCIKCGREVGPDESMCATCNQAGMVAPSATQVHGTIFVAIVLGVVLLGVLGSLVVGRGGPYDATVVGFEVSQTGGLDVALQVGNGGDHPGRGRCQLTLRDGDRAIVQQALTISPRIEPQADVEFTYTIVELTEPPASVEVICQ